MTSTHGPDPTELLGTRLRRLLELLDSEVAAVYAELGLPGFRLRYAPILRVLATSGPASIRELADAIGVTHSAASQTVTQLARDELVTVSLGEDARQRIVRLAPQASRIVSVVNAEWVATVAAARELEAELPYSMSQLIDEMFAALERRSLRSRVVAHFSG
ncbi:MarR family transcriptional regulator [Saccharomonospora sp. NPDC046836]|uniref:MarR family winged helix-turn-helix transcriptional regulator n=1 Tax=Saccharomonospora sp. NPDC046836 TaxID=3156921 RepID=UPI003408E393